MTACFSSAFFAEEKQLNCLEKQFNCLGIFFAEADNRYALAKANGWDNLQTLHPIYSSSIPYNVATFNTLLGIWLTLEMYFEDI